MAQRAVVSIDTQVIKWCWYKCRGVMADSAIFGGWQMVDALTDAD